MTFAERSADAFRATRAVLPGHALAWADRRRAEAFDQFVARGVPGRKVEAWRWTDLRSVIEQPFVASVAAPPPALDLDADRFEIIDGRAAFTATGNGVSVMSLAEAFERLPEAMERHFGRPTDSAGAMGALNVALGADGVVIHLAAGVMAPRLIHLDHVASGAAQRWHGRGVVILEAGARARIVESHRGPDGCAYFAQTGFDVALGAGARLDHVRIEREGDRATHLTDTRVSLDRDAVLTFRLLSLGARLARADIAVALTAPGASARIDGAYVADGARHVDTTALLDHASPGCVSHTLVKGVVGDGARGVFQGKVLVRPGAVQTEARQTTKALLLSDRAEVDHKPELEIHADDVTCAHGATVGDLDEQALFYLQARGVPIDLARVMLIRAFLAEMVDGIDGEDARAAVTALVDARLDHLTEARS